MTDEPKIWNPMDPHGTEGEGNKSGTNNGEPW
jgi:hypothetical protein